jgi:predicted secreted Zn-dependent protease
VRAVLHRPLLLIALLSAMPLPALAVEKCVSPQGKVTYSEAPCPAGSKSSTVRGTDSSPGGGAAAPAMGSGGSKTEADAGARKAPAKTVAAPVAPGGVSVSYYEIQGTDFESLLASLKDSGGFHGKPAWKLSYNYEPKRAGKACSIQSFSTQLELSMGLPNWTPPAGTSAELQARWRRYVGALRTHQEGHFRFGRDFEAAFKKSMPVLGDLCRRFDARVKEVFSTQLKQYQNREADYDRDTFFGATQGAVLK